MTKDEALKENTEAIQAILPLDMATYLLNEKRHELNQLEARVASRIIIIPSDELSSPQFQIKRLRSEELDQLTGIPTYEQAVEIDNPEADVTQSLKMNTPETAQVQLDQIGHTTPPIPTVTADQPAGKNSEGLIQKISKKLFGSQPSSERTKPDDEADKDARTQQKPRSRSNEQHKRGRSQGTRSKSREKKPEQSQGQERRAEGGKRRQQTRGKSQTRDSQPKKSGGSTNRKNQGSRGSRQDTKNVTQSNGNSGSRQTRKPGRKKREPDPPYISTGVVPDEIPADLPDDIGNRKN